LTETLAVNEPSIKKELAMLPTPPPGLLLLEFVCGSVRVLRIDGGGSAVSHAIWLLAALLPAAYWVADRLVASSWSHSFDDGP